MVRTLRIQAVLLIMLAGSALVAQNEVDLSGRWLGTLDATVTTLRIQLNVRAKDGGGYEVTLDSLDQGANGLAATIAREGSKVTVALAVIRSEYVAELSGDGKTLTGVWKQAGRELPLTMVWQEALPAGSAAPAESAPTPAEPPAPAALEPHAAQLPGLWLGNLLEGTGQLRLLFKLRQDNGMLMGTVVSLDQQPGELLVQVRLKPERGVLLNVPAANGFFEGVLTPDGKQLKGSLHQGGAVLPLVLNATESEPDTSKPQEPKPPLPYTVEEVRFPGGAPGVTLAGSLTLPEGKGPFPAAVLVSGSGPQNRDSVVFGHKPFLVLADHLTRAGIAVLRYDDRGVGASTGEHAACTTRDLADDAAAAFTFLRNRHDIRPKATGIIGHSEGGMIAPMVAAERPEVRFMVSLAGPAVPGGQLLLAQSRAINLAGGQDPDTVAANLAKLEQVLDIVREDPDPASAKAKFAAKLKAEGDDPESTDNRQLIGFLFNKWMMYFVTYDPAEALRKVACASLFLFGEKDLQVLPEQNRPALEAVLAASSNKATEVRTLTGMNHLFQTSKTGSPNEYAAIEETIAPAALEAISGWIVKTIAAQ